MDLPFLPSPAHSCSLLPTPAATLRLCAACSKLGCKIQTSSVHIGVEALLCIVYGVSPWCRISPSFISGFFIFSSFSHRPPSFPFPRYRRRRRIKTGSAVATPGKFGKLRCNNVIHAVGKERRKEKNQDKIHVSTAASSPVMTVAGLPYIAVPHASHRTTRRCHVSHVSSCLCCSYQSLIVSLAPDVSM